MLGRLRALGWVVIAIVYFLLAERIAASVAIGLATGAWEQFWYRALLLFLLVVGYGTMGVVGEHQYHPLRDMGLGLRKGWGREIALGAAMGWGGMVACVLPIAVFGGLYVSWHWSWAHLGVMFVDIATLGAAALAEEVAFRGYPFQRLIDATGPVTATVLAALAFGMIHLGNPNVSAASTLTTVILGWLLALAYLRTRALWVGFGLHFAWNVVMGVLFGLPISGLTRFSPLVQSYAYGSYWLTGNGYGPEGGAIAIGVLLVLLVVMMMATRELYFKYGIPEIVPGGIPVDIDEMARRQHEAAMGERQPAAEQPLVQIGGIPSVVTPRTMAPMPGSSHTWSPVTGPASAAPVRAEANEAAKAESESANSATAEGEVLPEAMNSEAREAAGPQSFERVEGQDSEAVKEKVEVEAAEQPQEQVSGPGEETGAEKASENRQEPGQGDRPEKDHL